jgi:hypothetical protein
MDCFDTSSPVATGPPDAFCSPSTTPCSAPAASSPAARWGTTYRGPATPGEPAREPAHPMPDTDDEPRIRRLSAAGPGEKEARSSVLAAGDGLISAVTMEKERRESAGASCSMSDVVDSVEFLANCSQHSPALSCGGRVGSCSAPPPRGRPPHRDSQRAEREVVAINFCSGSTRASRAKSSAVTVAWVVDFCVPYGPHIDAGSDVRVR